MHNLYFVKINKEQCETSEEARQEAYNNLIENGFVEQGYFTVGKADFFVIGGRWSGLFGDEEAGRYEELGSENDAVKINKKIIDQIKQEYGDVEVFNAEEQYEFLTKDLSEKDYGDWLVVVDYHS